MNQYEWVVHHLSTNKDSRKALINISGINHKKLQIKDYPCTLGLQFFIKNDHLCCSVTSRSTDIYWGLAYDMGFFSFVLELVYQDLKERFNAKNETGILLGHVIMKTHFSQIYNKTRTKALQFIEDNKYKNAHYVCDMPSIDDAQATLNDIYNKTQNTRVIKWIYKHANL